MFAGLGRLVHRRRWTCLVLLLGLMVGSGVWGSAVLSELKNGGFEDPKASSTLVAKLSATYLGSANPDVLLLYRSDTMTVDDPEFMASVLSTVARLPKSDAAEIQTYWSTGYDQLVSKDRHATFAAVKLAGKDELAKLKAYEALKSRFQAPGLELGIAGAMAMGQEFNTRMAEDLVRAEMISLPVLLVLMLLIFGSVGSFWLPLAVGIFSAMGALAVLRLITMVTDVSNFAPNLITMLGLGLAIDYSLFIVNRFREELAGGADRETALANTMATAGRTVAFSAITVATSMSGLLLFPQMFLRSIGLGGIAVLVVAMVAALGLLPALLAVLGHRIEFLQMPWRKRKARAARERGARLGIDAAVEDRPESSPWYRLGRSVMRRPLPYFLVVTTLLGVFLAPFLHVQFGSADIRVLPAQSEVRKTVEAVKQDFPGGVLEPIDVVLSGDLLPEGFVPTKKKPLPPNLEKFRGTLRALPGVTAVELSGFSQTFGAVRLAVTHKWDPTSLPAQDLVKRVRALPPPELVNYVDVGGGTAGQMDLMSSLMRTLPWMGLVVGVMTFVLLFAAFGSVLLPIKAVLMNMLSIGASFGAIVWAFQDGNLAGVLDFTATGTVEATSMVLILAVVFGLSMDYEVFLLSRIREEWDRTHDNMTAVAVGMQRTGGIITSAAVLFLVVVALFSMASISVVKLIGVGMFVAIIVDATLVRCLLVPATMRYLGAANWWLPGPLARLHRHMDLRESSAVHAPSAASASTAAVTGGFETVAGSRRGRGRDVRAGVDAGASAGAGTGAGASASAGAGAGAGAGPVVRADVVFRPTRRPTIEPRPAEADVIAPPPEIRQPSGQFAEVFGPVPVPVAADVTKTRSASGQPRPYAARHSPEPTPDPLRHGRPGPEQSITPRWEGPRPPAPRQHPPKTRQIMPNPDGSGWRWRTADDE